MNRYPDYQVKQGPLKIIQIKTLKGANFFSGGPVVLLKLDLGKYDEVFSNEIPGLLAGLTTNLPTLNDHFCSVGKTGGFLQRVKEGTLLGHITEHVAIELLTLAGMNVSFGKTRMTEKSGVYNVVFRYFEKNSGLLAGKGAVNFINAVLQKQEFNVKEIVGIISNCRKAAKLPVVIETIKKESEKRELPCIWKEKKSILQLGTGVFQKRLRLSDLLNPLDKNSNSQNNQSQLLERLKLSNIPTLNDQEAYNYNNYKLLVIDKKFQTALKTTPASKTIDDNSEKKPVSIISVSREVSAENKKIAEKTCEALELISVEICIAAPNLVQPLHESGGGVVSVLPKPDLTPYLRPFVGKSFNVAAPLLKMLYPEKSQTHAPLIVVTGSEGKSDVMNILSRCLAKKGINTGIAFSTGLFLNNTCVKDGQINGSERMAFLNEDPSVECGILEIPVEEILSCGLPYLNSDMGIVTNVRKRDIKSDYATSLDDVAYTKSVVVEQVRDKGSVILNADQALTLEMENRTKARICLFSQNLNNHRIKSHFQKGHVAVVRDQNLVSIHDNCQAQPVTSVENIPFLTPASSTVDFEVLLAAISALYLSDFSVQEIAECLHSTTI